MRGQKRLEAIRKKLLSGLTKIDPENEKRYEIRYETMPSTHVNARFLPPRGYQFLLVDKEEPNEAYVVQSITYGDLIRPYTYGNTREMDETDRNYEFLESSLKKGIKYLRKTRKDQGGLEKATVATSIGGIVGAIFFLFSNITGNTVANVSQSSGNILGAILLVVGLVAGFFWVKKK